MKDKLMTVSEFARLKDVSQRTIYNWIERGYLDSIKVGKVTILVNPEEKYSEWMLMVQK